MRAWSPKRKKTETADLIAQADARQARGGAKDEDLRRIRISSVRMAAAAPPVVALSLLILFPFLMAEPAPAGGRPPGGGNGGPPLPGPGPVGSDPDQDPRPPPVRPRDPPPPRPPAPQGGEEDLGPPSRRLLDSSLRFEERTAAADLLARSRDARALETLLQAAVSRDSATRVLAARGLTRHLPDPSAFSALRQLLDDPVPLVAGGAAQELCKGDQARELLVGRLQRGDPPDQVHLDCIRGLLYQGNAEDVNLLLRYVGEADPVGAAAVEAVWGICQRTGAPPPPGLPKQLR